MDKYGFELVCDAIRIRSAVRNDPIENTVAEFLAASFAKSFRATKRQLQKLPPIKSEEIDTLTDALYGRCQSYVQQQFTQEELKGQGVVFTPLHISRHICELALKHWKVLHRTKGEPKNIADLSCGIGSFLISACRTFDSSIPLYGSDINSLFTDIAILLMWACGKEAEITCEDQLTFPRADLSSDHDTPSTEKYDVLIGNPPYVRSPTIPKERRDQLKAGYESVGSGNFDLSIAFIEDSLEKLNDGGILSYIVTSKFSNASYGKDLCKLISSRYRVVNIEDYSDAQIFEGFTTYTMCITIAKMSPAKRFTVTSFPGQTGKNLNLNQGEMAFLDSTILKSHPWRFAGGEHQRILSKVNNAANARLIDVIGEAFQGLRTGANNCFVVNGKIDLEKDNQILKPFISGGNIGKSSIDDVDEFLIFPYLIDDFGGCAIASESTLKEIYPKIYHFLQSKKEHLGERSLSKDSKWFAYSRPQNLEKMSRKKLFIKEMMPTSEFAADFNGEYAFASGYALDASRISNDDLAIWTAILNTPTLEFVLRNNGTQLHSGWFRLQKQHLNRIRVPVLTEQQKKQIQKVLHKMGGCNKSAEVEIDKIVRAAYNLDTSDAEVIASYLSAAHLKSKPQKQGNEQSTPQDDKHADEQNRYEPVKLNQFNKLHVERFDLKSSVTFRGNKLTPIHSWYKYTQGFSHDLVSTLLKELDVSSSSTVLDPFMGCGTTLVTCKDNSIPCFGVDVSPLMKWVCDVKTHTYDCVEIDAAIQQISSIKTLQDPAMSEEYEIFRAYFDKAYSPRILKQIFSINATFRQLNVPEDVRAFLQLGLISVLEDISQIRKHGSHYRYLNNENSVGLQKLNIDVIGDDEEVLPIVISKLEAMSDDVSTYQANQIGDVIPVAICGDARTLSDIPSNSITHVITSPPYLNRNNYISQQKAELALLSMIKSTEEYKALVRSTFSSHVEGNLPERAVSQFKDIDKIISNIELEPGNNPKIPHMICGYFDDLFQTLGALYRVMKPGGEAAFVVGNTRWGGVVIPVDHLLAEFAQKVGFKASKIFVTRMKGNSPQQMKKFGKIDVRESIVIFTKPD